MSPIETPAIEEGRSSLEVKLGPIALKNPVMTASGTWGYGHDVQPASLSARLGAICTKGLSLLPRAGNPPPRICETPSGMLNAIGLANIGVERFVAEVLPVLVDAGVTVFANVFAESVEDFARLGERLARAGGIAALELNVSCPNVGHGGMHFGRDPAVAASLTRAVASASGLPVVVKLTPEAPDLVGVARACEDAGAAALSAINTLRGMAIDIDAGRPRLSTVFGGLSGPAIRPIALRMVHEVSAAVSIPVIGIGGITTAGEAIEFLMAGASAVQVGTASFLDPMAPFAILTGIEAWCSGRGLAPRDLTGIVRRKPREGRP